MESSLELSLSERERTILSIKQSLFEIAELINKKDDTLEISNKIGKIYQELDHLG